MGFPHPLLHTGLKPPLCSNDTRSGEGQAVFAALPHGSIRVSQSLPDAFAPGFFVCTHAVGATTAILVSARRQ